MKEPFAAAPGRLAESIQGRDKGRVFIVTEVVDTQYVMIADGRTHTLSHPKKKKLMHLRLKPECINLDTLRLEGGPLQDSDFRRVLEERGFGIRPVKGG